MPALQDLCLLNACSACQPQFMFMHSELAAAFHDVRRIHDCAQLDHWLTDGEQGNICIEIAVPAGQLELGKLLIKGMYFATLDLSQLTQQQLLQLMVLADR
jgi:hypothetical protein